MAYLLYNNDLWSYECQSLIKYIKTKDYYYFHNDICEIYEAFIDLKLNYKDEKKQLMVYEVVDEQYEYYSTEYFEYYYDKTDEDKVKGYLDWARRK